MDQNHQSKRVQQEGYKQESHIYSACLSPESVAIHHVHLAGLLACSCLLPSHPALSGTVAAV
jgi:hypothetical protein